MTNKIYLKNGEFVGDLGSDWNPSKVNIMYENLVSYAKLNDISVEVIERIFNETANIDFIVNEFVDIEQRIAYSLKTVSSKIFV